MAGRDSKVLIQFLPQSIYLDLFKVALLSLISGDLKF